MKGLNRIEKRDVSFCYREKLSGLLLPIPFLCGIIMSISHDEIYDIITFYNISFNG